MTLETVCTLTIAEPLSYIFNLSLLSNEIPKIWKSAFVLPLLKGG